MTNPNLAQHISKAEINRLPMRRYEGPIHVIHTPAAAKQGAETLSSEALLGFDTETRSAFRVGESYGPSLLQLASEKEVYLFQIEQTGLIPELREILSNPKIIKSGVAIRRDVNELRDMADFKPAGFVDLADCAKRSKIKNLGLRGLGALFLGFRISKGEQVSNWAKRKLTESQITYAATDAWLGREIYLQMEQRGLPLTARS